MMNPIQTILVDDEAHARGALRGLLAQNFPHVQIIGEAENVPQAVKLIVQKKPQLVFLDVEMPGYLGVELLDFFTPESIDFQLIFVTAYNEFALKAFEMSAVDYLLKPTRPEFVERALNKATKLMQSSNSESLQTLKSNLQANELNRIAFQVADGVISSAIEDIIYLKADSSYTHIFFRDRTKVTVSKTLLEYNSLQETGVFFRLNRSHIINVKCVERISKKEGGFVKMITGEEISATAEQRANLLSFFKDQIY